MSRPLFTAVSLAASALFIAATQLPAPVSAQNQLPRPGQLPPPGSPQQQQRPQQPPGPPQAQQRPPQQQQQQPQQQQQQAAPARPYKAVAINAPVPVNDPSFEAFRKQLGDVAKRKDRAGLARLVVAQGFFWEGEKGDRAEKGKSGVDNLALAIGLNAPDGSGWQALAGFVEDPTGMPVQQKPGVICSPADPVFDDNQFQEIVKATGTQEGEWGYPMQPGVEVRSAAQAKAPVVEKLGMNFVRVMPDDNAGNQQPPMLRIVTPSGKVGFVPAEAISPLGNDQICYVKDATGWKVAGFVGGGDPQQ